MKTIGIIALSGIIEEEKLKNAKQNLEKLGFNIRLSDNILDQNCYLAGTDSDKLKELHKFFSDKNIDIIMCARGGYGAIRLVNRIDYNIIKNNPKPFIGFSDVTALHLMIYKKTGMITFHGPMACSDFGGTCDSNSYSYYNLINALEGKELIFSGNKIFKEGKAQGIIWGGNLATVVSLCGQDFIPEQDFIFFAEDVNEPVYKIDRMFQQLFNIEIFKKYCKGIVLGDFLGSGSSVWLENLFYQFPVPTAAGFKITHLKEKITIPIGRECCLDLNKLTIR